MRLKYLNLGDVIIKEEDIECEDKGCWKDIEGI